MPHCIEYSRPIVMPQKLESSQLPKPSPDGRYIATCTSNGLQIHSTSSLELMRDIHIPLNAAKFLCIRWSPSPSTRILFADETCVRVFDLYDDEWSATIDNGSGGLGKLANVEFGSNDAEILAFSSFNAQLTIWSLWSGQSIDIKDPKFNSKGYATSLNGRFGIFALLSRPSTQDIITLHTPGNYDPIISIPLPTVDAQNLKWSPDGRWLAVWDTPSMGYKVLIFTADGQHYRTYRGDNFDESLSGLGVKSIEWHPSNDFLAVSGYESKITLLNTRTFTPAVYLAQRSTVQPSNTTIWQEQGCGVSIPSYVLLTKSIKLPYAAPTTTLSSSISSTSVPALGTSLMAFNNAGTHLATKDDRHPCIVSIWDLGSLTCRASLVHANEIKRLAWCPSDSDQLLIQTKRNDAILHLWSAKTEEPRIINLDYSPSSSGPVEASWIPCDRPTILFADNTGAVLGWPDGQPMNTISTKENSTLPTNEWQHASMTDEDDSLFEILSGKANGMTLEVEDTFQHLQSRTRK